MIFFIIALCSSTDQSEVDFGVSVDAGSSGTRLYLYAWNTSYQYPVPVQVGNVCKSDIPLHTAYYDDTAVGRIFDNLINCLDEQIKSENLNKSLIDFYVYYTTSVRNLEVSEQQLVLNRTYKYLKTKTTYNVTMNMLDILTPEEEGIYTWITVNLLLNTLEKGENTYPVVTMGSTSVQIVQAHGGKDEKFEGNTYDVNINDINHTLFCKSNTKLGINSGFFNHTRTIAAIDGRSIVKTPCYLKDYSGVIGQIDINGDGNSSYCTELLSKHTLINDQTKCSKSSYCTFDNQEIPNALDKKEVYATDVFAYAADFFGWTNNQTMTLKDQIDFTKEFCELSKSAAVAKYGNDSYAYLMEYCAQLSYTNYYLSKGFGIPETSHVNRLSTLKSGGVDVKLDYLFGAVLSRAYGGLTIKEAPRKFPKIIAIAIAVVLGVALIGVIVYIVIKVKKVKYEKDEKREKEIQEKLLKDRGEQNLGLLDSAGSAEI